MIFPNYTQMAGHNNLPIAIGLARQLYVFQSQMDWVVGHHFPFNPQWTGWWATPSLFQSPTDWPVEIYFNPQWTSLRATIIISISN
jgi:hypothetical protein